MPKERDNMENYLDMTGAEKESTEFSKIEDGEYEVEIDSALEGEIPTTHTPKLKVVYTIRSDIDQNFKGRKIFEDWFKNKATNDYNKKRLKQLILATARAEPNQVFHNLQEILDFLVGKQVIVVVKNEDDSWNGQTRTRLNVKYWKESQHKPTTITQDNEKVDDVPDSDLPF